MSSALEEHFRKVADVKELLSSAGISMRATAVDALLQMVGEGVTAEGIIEALESMKEKKIQANLAGRT